MCLIWSSFSSERWSFELWPDKLLQAVLKYADWAQRITLWHLSSSSPQTIIRSRALPLVIEPTFRQ